jgi:hypothetical protein
LENEYNIFEVLPRGRIVWLMCVRGEQEAVRQARELAKRSTNEIRVVRLDTVASIVPGLAGEARPVRSFPVRNVRWFRA